MKPPRLRESLYFMSTLQKFALRLTILSFGIAAAMGIAALLMGEFGDLQARVLGTTFSIGVMSVAILCYLAPRNKIGTQLGIIGFITGLASLAIALVLIWFETYEWGSSIEETLYKSFGCLATVSATIAQICLLISMVKNDKPLVTWLFRLTVLAASGLAVMIIILILSEPSEVEWFIRTLGVVAIIDAFGTVTLIAIRLFMGAPNSEKAKLSPYTQRLINEVAAERGVSPQHVLDQAINIYVTNATAASQAPPRDLS